ncbi:MAG TPA: CoB--CoM heterodisulfide reductase iron-sulfur subunit A family protein [Alphaproteobacteria bacterium]|nr:CoB--CoM heterodisulfide reductase iron-sulfur subunit A family protein [Alphaproteobacteria bacterium]
MMTEQPGHNKRVLIVGAGIAGMQAALDIANSGYEVVMVDRLPSIGGHMHQLSETFPTLDCAQCIMTPRTVDVGRHEKIKLHVYSEIEEIEGEMGDFHVRIRRNPGYVDWSACTGCGACSEKCPTSIPVVFDRRLEMPRVMKSGKVRHEGTGKAIYTLSPQAVPNKPVIDPEYCRYLLEGKCGVCAKVCPVGAIDYEQKPHWSEERVGAVILATGYELYPLEKLGEYGGGAVPDVIDALAMERLLSASGPTSGVMRRPSDGKEPHEVVWIQCAGSRDPELAMPYCSKICCMYSAKQAMLYKHKVHHGQAYVFYIDIRSAGKRYEEFIQRAMEEDDVAYVRGKVSKVFREGDKVMVWGVDTLTGVPVEVAADLVVISQAMVPSAGTRELADMLGLDVDEFGWWTAKDGHLAPLETGRQGIFLAGTGIGPKDIPEAVAQGSGAAGKVLSLFSRWGGLEDTEDKL